MHGSARTDIRQSLAALFRAAVVPPPQIPGLDVCISFISWPWTFTFVGCVTLGIIDSHKSYANWISTRATELFHLADQITDDAIDLFNHGFGKNFRLCANLDVRDLSAGDMKAFLADSDHSWNQFAERSIASSTRLPYGFIRQVNHAFVRLNAFGERRGPIQYDQILIKMTGDEIAKARIAMLVARAFEQTSKGAQ